MLEPSQRTGFGFFASTPRSGHPVVAALAHSEASFSWEVAQETRKEQGEDGHGCPTHAALLLRAREGLVGARVLVVAGAVVEEPLDAARAGPILHHILQRAHAAVAAHPAGREHPGAPAVGAAAAPTVVALVGVCVTFGAARHSRDDPGLTVQRFQLLGDDLRAGRLGSDDLAAASRAAEEPLA